MRTLSSIYLLCLSGMYLGLVPGYPIEDSDTLQRLQALHMDPNHLEEAAGDVLARIRQGEPTPSRLGRLITTYLDMVQTGVPHSVAEGGENSMDGSDYFENANTLSDYNQLSSKDDLIRDRDALLGSPSSNMDADYKSFDGDESRSKRQQGWYIQYGKRSQEPPLISNGLREHLERDYYKDASQKHILIPLLPSDLENDTGSFPLTTFLKNVAALARESGSENLDETDERPHKDEYARDKFRTVKRQHEQAWYTQYGKRSGENNQLYVL